jgi:hypothetical protein
MGLNPLTARAATVAGPTRQPPCLPCLDALPLPCAATPHAPPHTVLRCCRRARSSQGSSHRAPCHAFALKTPMTVLPPLYSTRAPLQLQPHCRATSPRTELTDFAASSTPRRAPATDDLHCHVPRPPGARRAASPFPVIRRRLSLSRPSFTVESGHRLQRAHPSSTHAGAGRHAAATTPLPHCARCCHIFPGAPPVGTGAQRCSVACPR